MSLSDVKDLLKTQKKIEDVINHTKSQIENRKYLLADESNYGELKDRAFNCGEQGLFVLENKVSRVLTTLDELTNLQQAQLSDLELKISITRLLESWKKDNDAMKRLGFAKKVKYKRTPMVDSSDNPDPRWMKSSDSLELYPEFPCSEDYNAANDNRSYSTLFFSTTKSVQSESTSPISARITNYTRPNMTVNSQYRTRCRTFSPLFTSRYQDTVYSSKNEELSAYPFPTPSDDDAN